jgi:hypothetical protein
MVLKLQKEIERLTASAEESFDLKTLVWSQIAMVEGA